MLSLQELKQKLKEEYGIESTKDLDEALAKIDGIDISIFVTSRNRSIVVDDIKTA